VLEPGLEERQVVGRALLGQRLQVAAVGVAAVAAVADEIGGPDALLEGDLLGTRAGIG
jgi:hypothetical protein